MRAASRVTGLPVLAGIAVLSDGSKRLVSLEVCGAESGTAWEGFLQGLIDRGLKAPRLCIIDGNAGLHRAITFAWRCTKIQRGDVHKQRNIPRKVPQHAHEEITNDYHLIMYAPGLDAATAARDAFMKKWSKRCPGAVESLNEAGDEVLTFYSFPKQRWKTIRTTNVIERINEEFRRRVKTQGSFPSESCALVTAREARGHPPAGGGAVYRVGLIGV